MGWVPLESGAGEAFSEEQLALGGPLEYLWMPIDGISQGCDSLKLGILHCCGRFLDGACERIDAVKDAIGRSDGWRCNILMEKVHRI